MIIKGDKWSALALFMCGLWFTALLATSSQVGVPRDESFYLVAADFAAQWYVDLFDGDVSSFSEKEIKRQDRFGWNWEHPVLMKSAFGLSKLLFVDVLGWTESPLIGYRIPTMLMAAFALFIVFALGRFLGGVTAGFLALGLAAFLPRMFFHSHLACFDMPVTVVWLLIVFCFIEARFNQRWIIPAGIALGVGFATKLNIFFLPFALLGFAVLEYLFVRKWSRSQARPVLKRYGLIGASFIGLGGLVFWLHWPLLYHSPIAQISRYIQFHARHVHYPVDYFGVLQYRPPFSVLFPFVMTMVSVPVVTLGLSVFGGMSSLKRWWVARRGEWSAVEFVSALMLLNVAVPLVVIALPNTPIFGGTKHWMPAMPFLAILAGVGGAHLLRLAKIESKLLRVVCGILLLSSGAWATVEYGAHGPVYYNSLVGGPPGAAKLGLSRNFWGHSTVGVLPTINESVEKNALVFWHKATARSISAYKAEGLLRPDVQYTGDWTADYSDWAVYHTQQEKLPEEVDIWRAYDVTTPFSGVYVDGLEIMSIYRRPEARR